MAQFQQMIIDYLEQYQPDEYEQLRAARQLRARIEALTGELYAETGRVCAQLAAQHPGRSEEQLLIEAEAIAIATILPTPDGAEQEPVGRRQEGDPARSSAPEPSAMPRPASKRPEGPREAIDQTVPRSVAASGHGQEDAAGGNQITGGRRSSR